MATPTPDDFESFLSDVCGQLTEMVQTDLAIQSSAAFQSAVGEVLKGLADDSAFTFEDNDHPQVFPDFCLGEFGVEVKFTQNNTWRSVANSVFEGQRSRAVKHIYIVFGKMGGEREVRFARYDHCIVHVRASHVPRFEVDLASSTNLFGSWGVTYEQFSRLEEAEKIEYIRRY